MLVDKLEHIDGVTFHDLYELYPDFNIDLHREQELLSNHDIVVWHHPFYWYSCPPLMKQWIDVVLEYRWAYGPQGNALAGKQALNVITAGGTREVYCAEGYNHYSINQFLVPFEQTAKLCGMEYLPPFAVTGTHGLSEDDLEKYGRQYQNLIRRLQEGLSQKQVAHCHFLNDIPELSNEHLT